MHVFALLLRKCTGIYILMRDSVQDITAESAALASTRLLLRRGEEQQATRGCQTASSPPGVGGGVGWKKRLGLASHSAARGGAAGVGERGVNPENTAFC